MDSPEDLTIRTNIEEPIRDATIPMEIASVKVATPATEPDSQIPGDEESVPELGSQKSSKENEVLAKCVSPQPIKVKNELIDEAEDDESVDVKPCIDESVKSQEKPDLNSEVKSEVFDRENSEDRSEASGKESPRSKRPKKKDFKLHTDEKLSTFSFSELFNYTKTLSALFKKKDKKLKKLKEKTKYLVSYTRVIGLDVASWCLNLKTF